jgi:heptaprenyl diphosphate synthase
VSIAAPQWLSNDLDRVEELLVTSAGDSVHSTVGEASTHLIKAGGKRVRPALVLLAGRAGPSPSRATDLSAAAIELVHLATLYHDDVIDQTETRRGVPTVHTKWGIEIAVLAGDFLFARGCSLGAEAGGEVPGILAGAIAEVCEGQIAETALIGDSSRSVDDYLGVIGRKTAALFRAACELGAATSETTPGPRSALVTYGLHLGLAFQIVDDVLDLVGDPEVTGKLPGTDLKEGVFTLPVLIACGRDPRLATRLASGDREIGTVLPRVEASGAIDEALDMAWGHARVSEAALMTLQDSDWRTELGSMIESVMAQVPGAAVA